MSPLRLALVAALLAATAVFAAGAIAERSHAGTHAEPAAHEQSEGGAGAEHGEQLLGVDAESTPLIAVAMLAGLGLAAAAASPLGRRTAVLAAIALMMLVWTALDVREVVHQLDESRTGIAVLATIAAALHLTAAVLSGVLAAGARHAGAPRAPVGVS